MRRISSILLVALAPTLAHAAEIGVGADRAHKTLREAVAAARAHDTIVMDEGFYLDDVATIDKPLTVVGTGRGTVLRVTRPISNRKAILVVDADVTVRRLTFEGAFVTETAGNNGAGIRHQSGTLNVEDCVFERNQNGILVNDDRSTSVLIRNAVFSGNGAGDGFTHGVYAGVIASLIVENSVFSGTKVGHNIKSRALRTAITGTILDDGESGTTSYAVDLPNGGEAVLTNVRVFQGPRTSNAAMVAFGAEGRLHARSSLLVTNSTFVNRMAAGTAIVNFTGIAVSISGNTFEGMDRIARGPAGGAYQ